MTAPTFAFAPACALLGLLGLSIPSQQHASDETPTGRDELQELQHRGEDILAQNQKNEITTFEARRKVQLLLKDLEKWGAKHEVELSRRTRTFSSPAVAPDEVLTADRCPLFYEEKLERLCPLDFSRSEVWGASVVFCRYLCAPDARAEPSGEDPSSWPQPSFTSSW
jgi:hypothetical protein